MTDKKILQSYINNFRRKLALYLRPGVGVRITTYPVIQRGGILEVALGTLAENDDCYVESKKTINEALKSVSQHAFGGDLDAFRFEGTNIVMEGNKILLIKGTDKRSEWNEKAAARDIERVLNPGPIHENR